MLAALTACSVSAQQAVRPGLSGNVSLHLSWMQDDSHLSTEQPAVLNSLDDSGTKEEKTLPLPMWDLQWGLSPSTALYFKSALGGMASSFYLQTGVNYYLHDSSSIGLGFIPGFLDNEVWEDPFLTGSARTKTDRTIRGGVFEYNHIAGSTVSFEFAGGKRRIEQEQSGSGYDAATQEALKREGALYYAALSQNIDFNRWFGIDWKLHYIKDKAEGKAIANNRYGVELTAKQRYQRYLFMLGASTAKVDYEDTHPIFDKTREDHRYGLSATLIYLAPFQWRNASVIARAGVDEQSSNINFYDETQTLFTLGLAYKF
ncbi:hypothetical protein EA58_13535 [Photobacterium galatheae]|uniref:DUF2860 domain-containing protein n=2 Tax=Photobacterium galatheae TaxID=1654360 RepID=A0A066RU37_9GAMM|nr:hypothetical protein EA58_13535 [Photobacterium galatheae]